MEKIENNEKMAKNMEKDDQSIYELGYHIVPSLSEDELKKEAEEIKSLVEKNKGTFVLEEIPKSMRLAYTMVKKQEGKNTKLGSSFFGWIKFEMSAEDVVLLKGDIDSRVNVLRFIIIKTIRESTSMQHRQIFKPAEEIRPIVKKPKIVKIKKDETPVSDEELDKTIEKLIS